jgi:hypothetical protein
MVTPSSVNYAFGYMNPRIFGWFHMLFHWWHPHFFQEYGGTWMTSLPLLVMNFTKTSSLELVWISSIKFSISPWHLIGVWLVLKCTHSHHFNANEWGIGVDDLILLNWKILHFIFLYAIDFHRWGWLMNSYWSGRCTIKLQQINMKHMINFHEI